LRAALSILVPAEGIEPPTFGLQSVTRAMARLLAQLDIEDGNTHDFRRTIAAWLSEREVRPDVIDAILAHKPKDVGGIHYQKRAPLTLIRAALQNWADHVTILAKGSMRPPQATQIIAARPVELEELAELSAILSRQTG
jgi:hypothetical protein